MLYVLRHCITYCTVAQKAVPLPLSTIEHPLGAGGGVSGI